MTPIKCKCWNRALMTACVPARSINIPYKQVPSTCWRQHCACDGLCQRVQQIRRVNHALPAANQAELVVPWGRNRMAGREGGGYIYSQAGGQLAQSVVAWKACMGHREQEPSVSVDAINAASTYRMLRGEALFIHTLAPPPGSVSWSRGCGRSTRGTAVQCLQPEQGGGAAGRRIGTSSKKLPDGLTAGHLFCSKKTSIQCTASNCGMLLPSLSPHLAAANEAGHLHLSSQPFLPTHPHTLQLPMRLDAFLINISALTESSSSRYSMAILMLLDSL